MPTELERQLAADNEAEAARVMDAVRRGGFMEPVQPAGGVYQLPELVATAPRPSGMFWAFLALVGLAAYGAKVRNDLR